MRSSILILALFLSACSRHEGGGGGPHVGLKSQGHATPSVTHTAVPYPSWSEVPATPPAPRPGADEVVPLNPATPEPSRSR